MRTVLNASKTYDKQTELLRFQLERVTFFCVACDASTDLQQDIKELRRRVKLQVHQVDQMKEELAFKEGMVAKVSYEKTNVEKEMEHVKVRRSVFTVQSAGEIANSFETTECRVTAVNCRSFITL